MLRFTLGFAWGLVCRVLGLANWMVARGLGVWVCRCHMGVWVVSLLLLLVVVWVV